MSKMLKLSGAVALLACATAGTAEAKLVRYEIDGKIYSYSTNNRQQVREAQQRINAANAAKDVKAKADAELAANPLVRIFGSQTQRQAAEAQARIGSGALSANADLDTTSSLKSTRVATRRSAKRERLRTERKRAVRHARLESPRRPESARAQNRAALGAGTYGAETRREEEQALDAPKQLEPAPKSPALETTYGRGELSGTFLPETAPREPATSSLSDFVNQVRRAPPGL